MINLIPNQEKKKMAMDFYYRLAVLSVLMLCAVVFVAVLALLPAYLLSNSKSNIALQRLELQKAETAPFFNEETREIIKETNKKLDIIETAQSNKFSVSEKVINAILKEKISGIKIAQIAYENNTIEGKKIRISGTAPSRDVLLLFRKTLESSEAFKNVDLPISNFVKGSNIEFYISLIPA